MSRLGGWLAIGMALFAIGPSIVPGAFSMFGLMFSMLALIVSLFSIRKNGQRYFRATGAIAAASVLLVNDALRIWKPLPMPLSVKIGLYGLALCVALICAAIAWRLTPAQGAPREAG